MSEHQPLVSLLVPAYNRADLLGECLDSALAQTLSDIEIVVVDGASTDGTWDVCLRYAASDPRIRIYRDDVNTGPVEGWWRCLELARGTLGTFLWSDDVLMPQFLATTAPMLADSRMAFAFTAAQIGPQPGTGAVHYAQSVSEMPSAAFIEGSLLGTRNLPVSPACALFRVADLRRSFMKELPTHPPFDLRPTGAGTDVLLYLITATRYPLVGCVDEPLAFFRAHAGSLTVDGRGGLVARSYGVSKVWFARSFAKRGLSARILARHWLAEMKSVRRPISPITASRRAGNVVRPAALVLAAVTVVAGLSFDRMRRTFGRLTASRGTAG